MAKRPNHDIPTALHGGDVRWTLDADGDIGLVIQPSIQGCPVYLAERDLLDMLNAIWVANHHKGRRGPLEGRK